MSFILRDGVQDEVDMCFLPYVAAENVMVGVQICGNYGDEFLE